MILANIRKIIETTGADFSKPDPFAGLHIRVENGSWVPLSIEGIGTGPHGHPAISVCHYIEQNGDLVQDPEMMFEWFRGEFYPYAIQMVTGYYQEVYITDDAGKVSAYRPKAKRDQQSFAKMWNTNIGQQGFVQAAKLMAKAKQTEGASVVVAGEPVAAEEEESGEPCPDCGGSGTHSEGCWLVVNGYTHETEQEGDETQAGGEWASPHGLIVGENILNRQ